METVNVHAAKTHLSRLIADAAAGKEIVIARAGRPVARLVAFADPGRRPRRILGAMAGALHAPQDFDAPLPDEVLAGFNGS